ncbi:hypothetical protein QIA17_03080 [Borreliella californiensis]|uniref:Uncharacterized protein n=1 Tax=Borreliella californiensis TaxID=373543 RepID=A0A7X0DPQ7_9SPIR|nr:hypothetical protein [Borreliella californiensis]MBB6212629.1 hypothetical protein [Borreliella californiensis]WKC91785.1 hypothetical protein QIA17_03080 [Borreliella californiensis]WNY70537.1 hypothetical protein QIA39_02545 [Borreliella californiensis]
MRYIFLFLIFKSLNLFALESFFYDFDVRTKYSKYFNSSYVQKKISPVKHFITQDYYIEVSSEVSSGYVYYSFFNKKKNVGYIFPGSYVIKVGKDGIEQIKIFFINRGDTFIRIKSSKFSSSADFYLVNTLIYKDVKLPFKIEDIAVISLANIINYIGRVIDFRYFIPEYFDIYKDISNMAISLRKSLASFPIAEVVDGAMDEYGKMVHIETGLLQKDPVGFNCSGFVKWVADSIYKSMTGRLLRINDLKLRHIGVRGSGFTRSQEFNKDPFFGLDWIRNIAYRINNINADLNLFKIKENDVNNIKFFDYVNNRGYKIENLEFLLYSLALDEPGYIYLGSISTGISNLSSMVLHKHVVLFLPFLDENRIFRVSVNEVNSETSIKSLQKRYPKSYIHLVRVKVPENLSIVPIPIKANNQSS